MCFIERSNTPTFWESRTRLFQQLSLKCPGEMPASRRKVFHPHSLTKFAAVKQANLQRTCFQTQAKCLYHSCSHTE